MPEAMQALFYAGVFLPAIYAHVKKRRDAQLISILTMVLVALIYTETISGLWSWSSWVFLMTWGFIDLNLMQIYDALTKEAEPEPEVDEHAQETYEASGVDDDLFEKLTRK